MGNKSKEKRGCGVMLPAFAISVGLLACAWAFFLGQTRGGETVSQTVGLSFWFGWLCGIGLTTVGVILFIIQRIIRVATGALDRATGDGRGIDDILPDLGIIDRFIR